MFLFKLKHFNFMCLTLFVILTCYDFLWKCETINMFFITLIDLFYILNIY